MQIQTPFRPSRSGTIKTSNKTINDHEDLRGKGNLYADCGHVNWSGLTFSQRSGFLVVQPSWYKITQLCLELLCSLRSLSSTLWLCKSEYSFGFWKFFFLLLQSPNSRFLNKNRHRLILCVFCCLVYSFFSHKKINYSTVFFHFKCSKRTLQVKAR